MRSNVPGRGVVCERSTPLDRAGVILPNARHRSLIIMFRSTSFAALGLVALAATASAQSKPAPSLVAGYIVSTDAGARTIEVKTGQSLKTYTIAEDARLDQGKTSLQAADLANATGQRITIWYTTNGDTRIASRGKLDQSKDKATAKVATPVTPAVTPE
jgi:hypothetical protein